MRVVDAPVISRTGVIHVQTWTDCECVTIASVAVTDDEGERIYTGRSVCHPKDTYVQEIGVNIAVSRALVKYLDEVNMHTQMLVHSLGVWK